MDEPVRIESSSVPVWRACIFAILWNGLMTPAYVMIARTRHFSWADFHRTFYTPITYIWFLFPVIGIWSAVVAIRRVAAARRYKPSVLTMQAGVVGGNLEAIIRAPGVRLNEKQRVRLTLRCKVVEHRTGYIDANEHVPQGTVIEKTVWKDARFVLRNQIHDSGDGAVVPVQMPIPPTCHPTGAFDSKVPGRTESASWWLTASAEPMHLWSATFKVPVQ